MKSCVIIFYFAFCQEGGYCWGFFSVFQHGGRVTEKSVNLEPLLDGMKTES